MRPSHATGRSSGKLARMARNLGVASRVKWLGHREDVSHLMAAADLLIHPARYDTTGTVILEAIVNGLPVITTAACGYARHVESADTGIVLREPFEFRLFLTALAEAQDPAVRRAWSLAGIEYGRNPLLYQGRLRAAEAIVDAASAKVRIRSIEGPVSLVPSNAVEQEEILAPPSVPAAEDRSEDEYDVRNRSLQK